MTGQKTGRHDEANGHIFATFHYEWAKKFTFTMA
jgi:hypothetical protein